MRYLSYMMCTLLFFQYIDAFVNFFNSSSRPVVSGISFGGRYRSTVPNNQLVSSIEPSAKQALSDNDQNNDIDEDVSDFVLLQAPVTPDVSSKQSFSGVQTIQDEDDKPFFAAQQESSSYKAKDHSAFGRNSFKKEEEEEEFFQTADEVYQKESDFSRDMKSLLLSLQLNEVKYRKYLQDIAIGRKNNPEIGVIQRYQLPAFLENDQRLAIIQKNNSEMAHQCDQYLRNALLTNSKRPGTIEDVVIKKYISQIDMYLNAMKFDSTGQFYKEYLDSTSTTGWFSSFTNWLRGG